MILSIRASERFPACLARSNQQLLLARRVQEQAIRYWAFQDQAGTDAALRWMLLDNLERRLQTFDSQDQFALGLAERYQFAKVARSYSVAISFQRELLSNNDRVELHSRNLVRWL